MLYERYLNYSQAELIAIIETPDAYTTEAREAAEKVLEDMHVLPNSTHQIAEEHWRQYIRKHFKHIVSHKIKLMSKYLNSDEIKKLIEEAHEYHMERQELFEIDLTKYWGAVL